ncbi:MAG: serine hydrolase [Limisphaerales bacterium]
MLLRNGHVVAEAWWKPESRSKQHVLWSLSKSFASTAVGLAVAEKKLNIDDKVIQFFPDDLPSEPSKNLKNMSVRDLLTMTCGHKNEVKLRSKKKLGQIFPCSPRSSRAGNSFQVQHSRNLHALSNRSRSYRKNSFRLFEALVV